MTSMRENELARIFGPYYAPWVKIAREAYWRRLGFLSAKEGK